MSYRRLKPNTRINRFSLCIVHYLRSWLMETYRTKYDPKERCWSRSFSWEAIYTCAGLLGSRAEGHIPLDEAISSLSDAFLAHGDLLKIHSGRQLRVSSPWLLLPCSLRFVATFAFISVLLRRLFIRPSTMSESIVAAEVVFITGGSCCCCVSKMIEPGLVEEEVFR